MSSGTKRWDILNKKKVNSIQQVLKILLENRFIKTEKDKKEFLNPTDPMKLSLSSFGLKKTDFEKAIKRIKDAKKNREHVIIYGDYDADGITGTAILWEVLHEMGIFVLPHIPERFSEGYGLNLDSVRKLKEEDPMLSLIITVDHGITAGKKIKSVKDLGIDMIITDHHQKGDKLPKPFALLYTTKIGGSALSWVLAREIARKANLKTSKFNIAERLELAAIGTIADQLPLTGINRSMVKYGLNQLNNTKRPGLLALYKEAGISEVGPFEIGFIIAPRINSTGRLKHGLESLRLICTNDKIKALRIASEIGQVNRERQQIVENVVAHALSISAGKLPKILVLANEKYHEGVIGLAASRLTEKFYRPAIVISKKGDIAKASARSISGFNIIETIRKLEKYYIEGGGHPMAAGFSIKTEQIETFTKKINIIAAKNLNDEMLIKKVKVDCEVDFDLISYDLLDKISVFKPTGIGNPEPVFVSKNVKPIEIRTVGRDSRHIKMKLKQNEHIFDSIFFGGGEIYSDIISNPKIEVVYTLDKNTWGGNISIQLKVKDIKLI